MDKESGLFNKIVTFFSWWEILKGKDYPCLLDLLKKIKGIMEENDFYRNLDSRSFPKKIVLVIRVLIGGLVKTKTGR